MHIYIIYSTKILKKINFIIPLRYLKFFKKLIGKFPKKKRPAQQIPRKKVMQVEPWEKSQASPSVLLSLVLFFVVKKKNVHNLKPKK